MCIRDRPYQVVLFDEVEKAHNDVLNLLLQVLEEGTLTDAHGRNVSFANSIIILTSNLGAEEFIKPVDNKQKIIAQNVMRHVKNWFKPEFLNRLDDIVTFNSLRINDIEEIISIRVSELKQLLQERNIDLVISEKAKSWIAKNSFDKEYGARPLKRTIESNIKDSAKEIVKNNNKPKIVNSKWTSGFIAEDRDLEQTQLVFGVEGLKNIDIDRFSLRALSIILGGGMSSRLFQEIREKRGLCYSIFSFTQMQNSSGVFGFYAGTSPNDVDQLLEASLIEWKKIKKFISSEELDRAKSQMKSGFIMGQESNSSRSESVSYTHLTLPTNREV